MIPESQFAEAVALAAPGRPFMCSPETYAGLTMLDNGPKPTMTQIQAAWDNRPAKPLPPISVTMAALRLALGRDVCIQIGAYIASITDVNAKWQAQTWWEKAATVNSSHPVVESFQTALGYTDEQVKDWFEAAKAIDNQ